MIQSHKNFEIIIIDNNSNDSTLDIVNSFKGDTPIKIISNDENMGYGNAINQNIKNISSEFIAVLNADVYLEKNWTNNLITVTSTQTLFYEVYLHLLFILFIHYTRVEYIKDDLLF